MRSRLFYGFLYGLAVVTAIVLAKMMGWLG